MAWRVAVEEDGEGGLPFACAFSDGSLPAEQRGYGVADELGHLRPGGGAFLVGTHGGVANLGGNLNIREDERRVQGDGDDWARGEVAVGAQQPHRHGPNAVDGEVALEGTVAHGRAATRGTRQWRWRPVSADCLAVLKRRHTRKRNRAKLLRGARPRHDVAAALHVERARQRP